MPNEIAAGSVIFVCLVWWGLSRGRTTWLRLAAAACLFAVLSVLVFRTVGTPFKPRFESGSAWIYGQQTVVAFWWLLTAKLLSELTRHVFRSGRLAHGGRLIPDLLAGLLYLGAFLGIVGASFGLPVGALVATSGVIAIVLGLALQSSLSDVFSGIAVSLEHPYAIGDRILIDGQTEGTVVQINWRSVRIQTDGDDVATIPNSVAAKSRIINRSVPTTRRRDTIRVPCPSVVSPERAIELIRRALLLCPSLLPEPAATVAISELGKRFNTYQVSFSARDGDALGNARSTLLMQVVRQFRAGGIVGAEVRARGLGEENQQAIEIPLFRDLMTAQLSELADSLLRRSLAPGDLLFEEGSKGQSLFIVVDGVLEVFRGSSHAPATVGRIGPGDYIGEIGLLTGAPHGAAVRSLTDAVVLELGSKHLTVLMTAQPSLLHALEASARRGQSHLDRSVAASVGLSGVAPSDLLSKIRAYFAARGQGAQSD